MKKEGRILQQQSALFFGSHLHRSDVKIRSREKPLVKLSCVNFASSSSSPSQKSPSLADAKRREFGKEGGEKRG